MRPAENDRHSASQKGSYDDCAQAASRVVSPSKAPPNEPTHSPRIVRGALDLLVRALARMTARQLRLPRTERGSAPSTSDSSRGAEGE